MKGNELIPFEGKEIRKIWYEAQWYFSVVDIIAVLTESTAPSKYWNALKRREPQVSTICRKLKMIAPDLLSESRSGSARRELYEKGYGIT